MKTQIFKSITRIFFLSILLLLLQGNVSLEAQTRIFRGTESNLWDNPFNWEPFGLLPVTTEDVVIDPTGPHTDVQMNIDVDIRSLEVKSGSLTVPAGKTLTISNATSGLDGIKVTTSLTNEGTINIPNAGNHGVLTSGVFYNGGNLFIGQSSGSIGRIGLYINGAGGILTNEGGTIVIDNTGTEPGTFEQYGIYNEGGQLRNQVSAEIHIGQNDGMIAGKGILGVGAGTSFTNDGSMIKIDNTGTNDFTESGSALWLVNAVMFENKNGGQVLIGQNGGNIGRDGITIGLSSSFKNTNGIVAIDNTGFTAESFGFGLLISTACSFLNEAGAQLLIGQNGGQIKASGIAIFNPDAAFTNNGGLVRIDNTGVNSSSSAAIALGGPASSQLTNKNDGQILIGQSNGDFNSEAISAFGLVSNEGCNSLIHIFSNDIITTGSGTGQSFTNEGVIIENASGNSNITINNGIVQNLNGGTFTIENGNPPINNTTDFVWQGCVSSDWSNAANWHTGAVPGIGADVLISNAPNHPEINTPVDLKSLHVLPNAQLTIQENGTLEINGATAVGLLNEGTILNQKIFSIGENTPAGGDGIHNLGVFTNDVCASMVLWDNLNNSGSFNNNGSLRIGTTDAHTNSGTFTNNGLLNHVWDNPIPSVINNEIIIQPTTANACTDISPAFLLGSQVDFTVQGVKSCQRVPVAVGDFDVTTNTFTPNFLLAEGTRTYCVEVQDPLGVCSWSAFWTLTTQNCCELPEAICQPFEAALDGNGLASITTADVDGGSTADCGLQSLSIDVENFDCSHVGTPQSVELTVTDVNGDSDQCTATVTVVDNELPTPICLNPIVEFNGEAEIFLEIAQIWDETNSSDNCREVYFIGMTPDKVTCEQLGSIVPLTVTVEDANGNTGECIANVTVGGLPCGFSAPQEGINCNNSNQATYDVNTEIFTLTSDGCYDPSYYRSTDSHGYVGTELCGDGEVIAHITQVNGNGWAGISMREGLGASDKMLQLMVDGVSMTRRELRQSTGATAFAHQFPTQGKNWLRLTRTGNTFGAYHSADGTNWQAVLITNIPMTNCIEVGMITLNSSPSGSMTATFENFEVKSPSALQAPNVQGIDIASSPEPTLEVYPNPAKSEAWIQFDRLTDLSGKLTGRKMTIEVYNNMGQMIYEVPNEPLETQRIRLDVADWLPGMYLIQMKANGQPVISKKLIVSD